MYTTFFHNLLLQNQELRASLFLKVASDGPYFLTEYGIQSNALQHIASYLREHTDIILVLSCPHLFPQPLFTHYYIDPWTNTITSSPNRNTQHKVGEKYYKGRDIVAQTQAWVSYT